MKRLGKKLSIAAIVLLTATGSAEAGNSIVIDGSTTVGPLAKSFAAYFTRKYNIAVTVSESGSGNGAKSLINKSCDIASMSRPLKPQELSAAKSKGVNPISNVVALDGIAIVVHPSNPVRSLTTAQIADIYKGKITNWSQVGGPNANIVVIQRESNSGTQESFKEMVVGKENPVTRNAETQASNGAVKSRVSLTRGAIGFLGLGFADSSLKKVAVNGVMPTPVTVKNGTYPLSRPLYFVTNGQPSGSVKQLVDLPKSVDGKKIINELGFINKY
ncbi:MAG: phosphate ABC transporter substrate-binding protein [Chlorobiaceae bacterium]|nr:phosphate ABC transporter substrate-binding protein [Chlorobiaceae bacterium]